MTGRGLVGPLNYRWKGGRHNQHGYVQVVIPGHHLADSRGRVLEHALVVFKVRGRELSPPAEIHHVNEIRNDNRPQNLVVCQDHAYHRLLHVRTNARNATGNPNHRRCPYCKKWDAVAEMVEGWGVNLPRYHHAVCRQAYHHAKDPLVGTRPIGRPATDNRPTHCKRGHELTASNSYIRRGRYPECRKCRRALENAGRRAKRLAIK